MSINNIANTVFPNTLSGLDSINVTDITINGVDVTTLFVPYTGANANVDLNNKNLSAVNNVGTSSVVATGLTTTNTLKIDSVPAGTTSKYLAVNATGNVIEADITTKYVPYTGASAHVNLNAKNLSNVLTYSGTNLQVTSTETTSLLATGLAQLGTLRISSVPAGTQTNLIAVDSVGNVIIGTAPASTQLNLSPTVAPTLYYFPFITSSSAGVQTVYTDNAAITLTYDTATKTLSPYRLKIQNVPAGTQTSLLAIDSAGNVIQGTSTPPTTLLTTQTGLSQTYYPTFVSTNTTGNKSYYVPYPQTGGYNITYTTTGVLGDIGTLNIPQLVIDASVVLPSTATSFASTPLTTGSPIVYGLGIDANNLVKAYTVGAPNVTVTNTNTTYYPVFVATTMTSGVKDLYQDTTGNDFNYNPSTNLLTVGNLAVNGTIGGPNTMTFLQGGVQLMTMTSGSQQIAPQFPVVNFYGGAGAPPLNQFGGNGGTGARFILTPSTTALYPVGLGIDTGGEMWLSNRGVGFTFYNNATKTVSITTTGGLILGDNQTGALGGLNINTQGTTQSIRMGWSNLASITSSGFFNIAIGRIHGPLVTSGYDNIMIGRECFPNLTTGNNNIAIGQGNATQITTGRNCIYIGSGASGSIGGTGNVNEFVMGTNALGNGTNTITMGSTDTTGFYLSADVDTFYRATRTDVGIKLGSMFDFSVAGGWNNSNSLFVTTGGMGGNNYGIGMGYNSVDGVGQLVCLAPNVSWQPIRYKASSHQFYNTNASVVTINGSSVSSVIPYVASTGYPVCYFMPSTVGNNSSFIIADSFATYTSPATTFCRIFGTSGILFQDSNAGFQWRSVPLATPYASATQLMTLNSSGLTVATANTTTINNTGTVYTNTIAKYSGDFITVQGKYINLNSVGGGYSYFSSTATNEVWLGYSNGNYVGGMYYQIGGYFASNHLQVSNHITTAGSTTNGSGVFIKNGQNGYGFDFWTYGYGATGASTSVYVISNWSGSGVQMAAGSTSWGAYSDRRCKKNVCCIGDGHKNLMRLKPVHYNYLTDEKLFPDKTHRHGFVAQEFAEVYPQHVSYNNPPFKDVDGTEIENPISIHMVEIIPDIVDSVQYLTLKAQRHKDRIIILEDTVKTQQSQIQLLLKHLSDLTEQVNELTKQMKK
jgi:hypothetical protein